ncbi:MAG: hypothetical protein EBZ47_09110, partial [Chlamydiae bacterium]|nr:hypothetical protein [Chlamydiota bacterium]
MKKLIFLLCMLISVKQLASMTTLFTALANLQKMITSSFTPQEESVSVPKAERVLVPDALQQIILARPATGPDKYNQWECGFYAAYHAIATLKSIPFSRDNYQEMLSTVSVLDLSLREEISAEDPAHDFVMPEFARFPYGSTDSDF